MMDYVIASTSPINKQATLDPKYAESSVTL